MKKIRYVEYVLGLFFSLMAFTASAQMTATIGTGTLASAIGDNSGPIFRYSNASTLNYSRHVMLYNEADLANAGVFPGATITKVAWYKTTSFTLTAGRTATMNILMQNSSSSALTTGTWSSKTASMASVYSNPAITNANIPAAAGWVEFTLITPFTYTGGALEIATDWAISAGTAAATTGAFQWQYTTTTNTQAIGISGSTVLTGVSNLTSSLARNMNLQLTFTGTPPACLPVTALNAAPTPTSASLNWTANNGETSWNIEYGLSGFTKGTGTVLNTTTKPYVLNGLTPNTAYAYYVQADCAGNGTSIWKGPFTFTTLCAAFTAPFTENFDGLPLISPYTALPTCWAVQTGPDFWDVTNDVLNIAHTYLPNIGDHTTGTANYMWIDASGSITANEMVTPWIDMSGLTTPYAGFWFASNNTTNAINHTIALDAWNGTAWVNVKTAIGNFPHWVEVAGALPAGVPTITKFRIYAIGNTAGTSSNNFQNDLGVDDFFVREAPSCPPPTYLTLNSITAATTVTANFDWTAGGSETSWQVEYGLSGFAHGAGTAAVLATNSYAVTGLALETSYQFYVRGICGSGDTSVWVGPYTFFTGYCTPAPSSVDDKGIANVTMGGINNTTVAEPGNYANYTAMVANTTPGSIFPISITVAVSTWNYDLWAWVDWNNDLDFTDAGEDYFLGTSLGTLNASITIPATASGNYRIRLGGADVGLGTTSPSNPCYTGTWGTFEDYTLNVISPCAVNSTLAVTNANCFGAANGEIAVAVSGGTAPFTYLWSNGQNTATATGLVAATYDVIITDANGCVLMDTATVGQPSDIVLTEAVTNASCFGAASGEIAVTLNGGTAPFTYLWSDGQTTATATNLLAATYDVIITDANGCILMDTIAVGQPSAIVLTATVTDVGCFGAASGAIEVTVSGGTAPYSYLWSDGQTTSTANNLSAAIYDVTITDANGCALVDTGAVSQPLELIVTALAVIDTINLINQLSAIAAGGTPPYTYSWNNGMTGNIISTIGFGTYVVTVSDSNGCSITGTVQVDSLFINVDQIDFVTSLKVFPNPTVGNITIDLELSDAKDVNVAIYDISGQLIKDFGHEYTSRTQIRTDLSTFPSGVYLVRFVIEDQVITKRLILSKY